MKKIELKESILDLYHDDCKNVLPNIPDNFIDAIICDLPFGKTACEWDTEISKDFLWAQYKRIIKPGGAIVLFGTEPFATHLRMSNIDGYKYDWIWDKHFPRGLQLAKVRPMQRHEVISVFTANGERLNYYPKMKSRDTIIKGRNCGSSKSSPLLGGNSGETYEYTHTYPVSILHYWEPNDGKVHPTQKPVELIKYLIENYTMAGHIVLDNCMGSGTTGIACKQLYRNFIGIEKDAGYFKIAEERINNDSSQTKV